METHIEIDKFRIWLQSKFMQKMKMNSKYSLRAFAKFLAIDPSTLSQLLSGKRKASNKVIHHIGNRLSVGPAELSKFINSNVKKKISTAKNSEEQYILLAEDAFAYISHWYHYAILELTFLDHFQFDNKWIAQTLSLTVSEVKMAIERMERLGLVKIENNILIKTNRFITNFNPGDTSSAHKELQRQVLHKGLESIDNLRPESKDITSMTMAIDVDKLPEARKLITKFRRELCEYLEDGERTSVYQLGIQLFQLSK